MKSKAPSKYMGKKGKPEAKRVQRTSTQNNGSHKDAKKVRLDKDEVKIKPNDEERFEAFKKDPKFRTMLTHKEKDGGGKIVVDQRFSAMFTDDEFKLSRAKVDKYGRKVDKSDAKGAFGDLSRHYVLSDADKDRLEELNRIARGEANESSSSSEDSDDEQEAEEEEVVEESPVPVELGEESFARLAILNCDWDHIRALDILAVMRSFVPSTGAILEVAVYSSEFGRKRMAYEEVNGPFMKDEPKEEEELDEEEENELTNEAGNDYDPEKLRKYEKDRLLYYFAVVTCDSVSTAETLYRECDGIEFEHSSVGLDLRFIPDDIRFEPAHLRDRADEVPDTYAPLDFVNKSLQQSRVQLSWDEPEHDRRKLLQWGGESKKKDQGIPIEELEAFIASEDEAEDSEDEAEKRQQDVERYRALLAKIPHAGKPAKEGEDEDEEPEDDFLNALDEDKDEQDEDGNDDTLTQPVERKEENPKKKHSNLFSSTNQLEKTDDDKVTGKKKSGKKSILIQEDEDEDDEEEATRTKKTKKKKKKKQMDDEEEPQIDVEDDRFAPLFTEPEFAIDRTDPKFKLTKTIKKIEEERQKRMKKGRS